MRKAVPMSCPHCSSQKVKQNGHHYGGKLQFFCHSCHRYFSEDVAKGYPTTNIPFPVIAYVLYFRKKVPEFSNMREFRSFVNQWLRCLRVRDKDVERHTIRYWIKHYEPDLESIISFHEAREYCKGLLSEVTKDVPEEVVARRTVSHTDALQVLEDTFGQRYCFDLVHRDEEFFDELCDIASKYKVYCWKLLDKEWVGRERRLFLARS